MISHNDQQGSDAWLASRKGCITGSRFKDARDRLADKPEKVCKKTGEITSAVRGSPSAKCLRYACDVARERCGGTAPGVFVTKAMQAGTDGEPLARMAYEALTGNLVDEVGFITDDDGMFGCSPDGLIDADGVLEIKTMVSSETLFTAVADGDISEYLDQCLGYLWLLGRQWVDLVLWAPDLEPLGLHITVIRIHRDEAAIEALEADLLAFAALVRENETKLRMAAEKLNLKKEIELMEEIIGIVQIAPPEVPLLADVLAAGAPAEIASLFAKVDVSSEVVDVEAICPPPAGTEIFLVPLLASDEADAIQDLPPTLRLGQIAERLGFTLTADFLTKLGFAPAGKDRAAVLYHEADFAGICDALVKRIVLAKLAA